MEEDDFGRSAEAQRRAPSAGAVRSVDEEIAELMKAVDKCAIDAGCD